MKIITMKTRYMSLISQRRKVQTIRKNSLHYRDIKVGDVGWITNYREKLKIRITKTYIKLREELTEEEAILDGFFSLSELLPLIPPGEIKIIRFELLV